MGYFQDMGVLLLYGMTALLWIKADRSFIFVLLCTVVLLCGEYFFERRLTKILGCVVFAGTSFFIPELVVFYSVMEYELNQIGIKIDMYRQEYRFTPAFAFIQAV